MVFLTFNDGPSGILKSQVIDVVHLLRQLSKEEITLVAYVSMRGFGATKKWILDREPSAKVIPMTPKLKNWQKVNWQRMVFPFQLKGQTIIARGVFAANIALNWRDKGLVKAVCYDGRGAIAAESEEYKVIPPPVDAQLPEMERRAVMGSDYRIAVTQKLIDWWSSTYAYAAGKEEIIPCTLSTSFKLPTEQELDTKRTAVRQQLNWSGNDTVLVYSGSTAGWQSFSLLEEWLRKGLINASTKVLFLSKEEANLNRLIADFPNQVARKWLPHNEVIEHLYAGDYGIMIREKSVTNRVASPTKFAEYLIAGLEVLSSDHIGDYPDFIAANECGQLVKENEEFPELNPVPTQRKLELMELGQLHFSKSSNKVQASYKRLLHQLNPKP